MPPYSFRKGVREIKISEVTADDVAKYLRLEKGDYDAMELGAVMAAAKQYIASYSGLSATITDEPTTLDSYEDLTLAYLVVCREMYDNRAMTVENGNANKVIDSILSLHARNLV